jgi:hypothetical protein
MDEMKFKDFLEKIPPGIEMQISDFAKARINFSGNYINPVALQLHCTSEKCQGIRLFDVDSQVSLESGKYNDDYLMYTCRNCRKERKVYSIHSFYDSQSKTWIVAKYGEIPAFGPPIPSRTYNFIGEERDLFLLGRKNENLGMGIGAFVYYRRVIESQKGRIFDELIRVISKISPNDAVIKELEAAKNETQFIKAVVSIKHALPPSLYINGYNPLTLLHSALSEGVHNHTDSECLELASDVRTVLFEFAERLGQALKEEVELNNAVTRLAKRKSS